MPHAKAEVSWVPDPSADLTARHSRSAARTLGFAIKLAATGALPLALATAAQNVLGLLFTLVFARWLGAGGYASLAVLVSAFLVLSVPGTALQVATARRLGQAASLASRHDRANQRASTPAHAAAGAWPWLRALALITAGSLVLGLAAREPLARLLAVDTAWGAGLLPATAASWALLGVARGAWQALGHYRLVAASIVGDASLRIVAAAALVACGLDVTGAFAGSGVSFVVVALVLLALLHRSAPPRRVLAPHPPLLRLVRESAVPTAVLALLLALQELHVILAKHLNPDRVAGGYAAVAVAAKAIMWVAVGLSMYVVPESVRRISRARDPRTPALHAGALLTACAVAVVALFIVAGNELIRAAFGPELTGAMSALFPLGVAMALLAGTYVLAQYHVALGRRLPLPVLCAALAIEIAAALRFGHDPNLLAWALVAVFFATTVMLAASGLARPSPVSRREGRGSPSARWLTGSTYERTTVPSTDDRADRQVQDSSS